MRSVYYNFCQSFIQFCFQFITNFLDAIYMCVHSFASFLNQQVVFGKECEQVRLDCVLQQLVDVENLLVIQAGQAGVAPVAAPLQSDDAQYYT